MKVQANIFIPTTVTQIVTVEVPSDWSKEQILDNYMNGSVELEVVDVDFDTEDPVYDNFVKDNVKVEIATQPYE